MTTAGELLSAAATAREEQEDTGPGMHARAWGN
jgi:hypothetical protein